MTTKTFSCKQVFNRKKISNAKKFAIFIFASRLLIHLLVDEIFKRMPLHKFLAFST